MPAVYVAEDDFKISYPCSFVYLCVCVCAHPQELEEDIGPPRTADTPCWKVNSGPLEEKKALNSQCSCPPVPGLRGMHPHTTTPSLMQC